MVPRTVDSPRSNIPNANCPPMEGADDERSAVSSDLGDASEDEELGALGDFRPSALGLSPPPGRLFKSASSAASSSPTLSLPESFDNLGSVASGPGGAPRAPGHYLEYGLRQQLEERLASSKRERDATVDGLEHKVRAYETLELELDSAVLRCADGTQGVDANGNVLASPELRDAALAAGLSRPERRVRHAVLLAQKLLRTEAELRESLQGEDGARAAAAAAAADAALTKLKLADAAKPTQFLLNALADRDKAVAALRTKLHRADKAATDAANSADATAEHNARLETEILRLVKHRDELAQLRSALSQLRAQQQQQPPPPPPGAYPPGAYPPGAFAPPPGPPPVVLAPPSAAPSVAPSARSSPRGMPPHTTPRQPAAATPGYYSRSRAVVPEVA